MRCPKGWVPIWVPLIREGTGIDPCRGLLGRRFDFD
ncbi:MAG: hypothetical protein UZ18_ATM001002079 [Armatimonadetes bacterium OLB18]|nr:MAG: hypothetical protein UZ18_ATM001002079 [Armatimonadetes bacterium OLB18]